MSSRFEYRKPVAGLLAGFGLFLLAGCSGGDSVDNRDTTNGVSLPETPVVLATTNIWADVVSNVACNDLAQVETVLPAGADPHSFEPSVADRKALNEADLIVANGLSLEESLEGLIEVVEADGSPVFRFGDHVETLEASTSHAGHSETHSAGENADPHIWLDPVRVSTAISPLAEQLKAIGLDGDLVDECAANYMAELASLDQMIEQLLAPVPVVDRKIVTNHNFLAYFADRYDLEVVGVVIGSSTLSETSPAKLDNLVQTIRSENLNTIFVEANGSNREASKIAATVEGLTLEPLLVESLENSDGETFNYVEATTLNAKAIAASLG